MKSSSLIVCKSSDDLTVQAADIVAKCAKEAIEERGRFLIALSGGTTPKETYRQIAEPDVSTTIDWSKTYVFFVDERFVPAEHEYNNYGMIRSILLSQVPIAPSQVFPTPTRASTAAEAAVQYEAELTRFFHADAHQADPPCFDLILLGLGEDGHTASLFPGAPALQIEDACVTWSRPGTLLPAVDRITLTYRVLNAARHIVFLVSGAKKATILHHALEDETTRDDCPAVGVQPTTGTVIWLVDRQAASLLTKLDGRT